MVDEDLELRAARAATGVQDPHYEVGGVRVRTDIFISYAREDGAFARELRTALRDAGLTVWMDDSSIPHGAPFLSIIHAGIEGASNVVVVLSPDFTQSRFCRLEVEHAVALKKRFVPVLRHTVSADDLHPRLAEINWVQFPPERNSEEAVRDCVAAATFDLAWANTGVRFLQRALDWKSNRGDLLERDGVSELRRWLQQAAERKAPASDLIPEFLRTSEAALRRRRWLRSAVGSLLAAAAGLPVYAIVTTPASAWRNVAAADFRPEAVAVTMRADGVERLWLHKQLGQVHHPNPHDPGDDVFEDKFALVELDLDGRALDRISYYVDASRQGVRVGDFEFDGEPVTKSELKDRLEQRLASAPKAQPSAQLVSAWDHAQTPSTAATRIETYVHSIKLAPGAFVADSDNAWLGELVRLALVAAPPEKVGDVEFIASLTRVEVFRLPSGAWIATCQLMSGRYDVGMFSARSDDAGLSWTHGPLVPRRVEGSGFFLHAEGITALVEARDGRLWMTTRNDLSSAMGHPSGAPGQVAVSDDGGLSWANAGLGAPIDDYKSFTGITIDASNALRIALSVEDLTGTASRPGAAVWFTEDGGKSWSTIEEGLDVEPSTWVQAIWIGPGPRIVATLKQDDVLRPIVFRPLTLLERLRGQVGIADAGTE